MDSATPVQAEKIDDDTDEVAMKESPPSILDKTNSQHSSIYQPLSSNRFSPNKAERSEMSSTSGKQNSMSQNYLKKNMLPPPARGQGSLQAKARFQSDEKYQALKKKIQQRVQASHERSNSQTSETNSGR